MTQALKVLITGAAGGIGTATAHVLAHRGHSVVATDIEAVRGRGTSIPCGAPRDWTRESNVATL